eukprot:gene7167-7927_t
MKIFQTDLSQGSQILSIAINETGCQLYAIYDNKLVIAWDIPSHTILGHKMIKKRPTSLLYSTIPKPALILADKFGDLLALRLPDLQKEILLGGHTASVVTDLLILNNEFLISADRDEKIRISTFPAVETITSYALGHKSVVSCLSGLVMNDNVLIVSSGWDHQICLWKVTPGAMKPLFHYACTFAPVESGSNGNGSSNSNEDVSPTLVAEEDEEEVSEQPVDQQAQAQAQAQEETEAEPQQQQQQGEEDDMIPEKRFVESDAGHYPFKVISQLVSVISASSSTSSSTQQKGLVAAIFREECFVKLLLVEKDELVEVGQIDLPAPPADILFLSQHDVLVLGPKPNSLMAYHLDMKQEEEGKVVIEVVSCTERIFSPTVLERIENESAADFTQRLVAEAVGFEGDTGKLLSKLFLFV